MDGSFAGLPNQLPGTVLQRFLFDRPIERRALYWRDVQADSGAAPLIHAAPDGSLIVADGGTVRFDTYFNAFFEAPWRRWTSLDTLSLRLGLFGTALLRIHRIALGTKTLLVEQVVGPGVCSVCIPNPRLNFRQYGVLVAELSAAGEGFSVRDGAWMTQDEPAMRAGLGAVFCTFNREEAIGRVLQSIAADAASARIDRIFVVNQGRRGLVQHPEVADAAAALDGRLTVIEQANYGGAGGFGRGMLAALDDPALSHVVLLDDDLELEPDSLCRMATFFSFCSQPLVLGGHMLDLIRPTVLYEAGAVINERHWEFYAQRFNTDLTDADRLEELSQPYAVHYNGWWCCGFPLSILREHGMPMPCFIRGDDVEFGLRLHQRGVPSVPMPGIAVWHEPFYLKLGGWQLYYETRNLLVAAAQHLPFDRGGVVRRIGRQIVQHLLTYRYFSAALVIEAVRDFLAGPSVMEQPPQQRHAALAALLERYPVERAPRERVAHEQFLLPPPKSRLLCLLLIPWVLFRNAALPSSTAPARHMPVEKLHWLSIRKASHIAVDTTWDRDLLALRRNRDHHRPLLREAATLILRLYREAPRAGAAWCTAMPRLTSLPFWHQYLNTAEGTDPPAPAAAPNATQHPAVVSGA